MKRTLLSVSLVALAVSGVVSAAELRPSAFEMTCWTRVVPPATATNHVFSPVGYALTVAMLGEGTGGETRAAIADAVGILSDFGTAFRHLRRVYEAANVSNRVSICMAPSLWTRRPKALGVDYIRAVQRDFGGEAAFLRDKAAPNAWTEVRTGGRVSDILPEVPSAAETIVLNAVSFMGAWRRPFDEAAIRTADFACADGTPRKVRYLRAPYDLVQIARPKFRVAKADFSADGLSFVVILPEEGVTLAELRAKELSPETVDEIKQTLREGSGAGVTSGPADFRLPEFALRSNWELDAALRDSMVPRSGFERMGEGPFRIDLVRQTVDFRLTPRGYSLTPGDHEPDPKKPARGGRGELNARATGEDAPAPLQRAGKPFLCNRPFLFFVWDTETDTFILSGQYDGPVS